MSVPYPGGDPNANLYVHLKRDVLDRVPQVTAVESVPDDIEGIIDAVERQGEKYVAENIDGLLAGLWSVMSIDNPGMISIIGSVEILNNG